MKIRTGFVSNSSSSSFIVAFPREPKNVSDVKEMLFKETDNYLNPYPYGNDEYSWPTDVVSKTVFDDICAQKKNDIENAINEMSSGTIVNDDNAPDYDNYSHIKDYSKRYDAFNSDNRIYIKNKIKNLLNIRKLKLDKINGDSDETSVLYCFEYSDNDSTYFSALEHGNLFEKLKYVRISKH